MNAKAVHNEKAALEKIAQLTETDSEWALKFCREVQQVCLAAPSFRSIARAIKQQGVEALSIRSIAERASRAHKSRGSNILPLTQPRLPSDQKSPVLDLIRHDASIQGVNRHLTAIIARLVLNSIITVSIESRTIAFRGNGPYLREDLERLAVKLGAVGNVGGLGWKDIDWLVIGRQGYDEDELRTSVKDGELEYLSQEEFLGVLFFGRTASPRKGPESEGESHPGMDFVDLCLTRWSEDREREVELELNMLGYFKANGQHINRRCKCLQAGAKNLGRARIVNYITRLIHLHKEDLPFQNAVSNWEEDLSWLKKRFTASKE